MKNQNVRDPGGSVERWALALVMWLVPIGLIILGVQTWMPPAASAHGGGIDTMLVFLLITTGIMLAAGQILLGYFILRFDRSPRATYRLASAALERKWALIPIVFMSLVAEGGVFVLGLPVWEQFYGSEAPDDAITVEVTGEQFAWNIRYPGEDGMFGRTEPQLMTLDNPLGLDFDDASAKDDRVLVGALYLPVDRAVRIRLRSKDTLHGFFLPHHRVKQDAVPGMTIDVWFIPTEVGTYEVACTELCGFGHFSMRAHMEVMPPEQFEQRLREEPPFSIYF